MRIVIIGAGIVGVTTAYELALQGHEVTVYERQGSVASEASFANAGLLAPALATPLAAPGVPWALWRGVFGTPAKLGMGGLNALTQLPWLWRFWRACGAAGHASRSAAMYRLANLSKARLQALTHDLHLDFEQAQGVLMLVRTERELGSALAGLALLREWGLPSQVIDAAACRALEPGLSEQATLHAGIHLPQDGVGNCRQFAHLLKVEAQHLGARFRFETAVQAITAGHAPTVTLAHGVTVPCEAVVVCAGVGARELLRGVGVRLPLAKVHGMSVTAPVRHRDGMHAPGPRAAVFDVGRHAIVTRLGQRVRVAGRAVLGGLPTQLSTAALRALYAALDDWFPGAVRAGEAQHWTGTYAMLPDGPPVLGESGATGIWLNLGHGGCGWTLACGSARVLAERLTGRDAPLDMAGLTVERWHH